MKKVHFLKFHTGLLLFDRLRLISKKSLTMPSSVVLEVPVEDERGGEGVADLNEELPEDSTGLGRLMGKFGLPN